jgi:hypothetical protein
MFMPRVSRIRVLLLASIWWSYCFGQTSSDLVKSDLAGQYKFLKQTMQQFYDQGLLKSAIDKDTREYDLALAMCVEPAEFFGTSSHDSDSLPKLVPLAATVVIWSNDLTQLGVPESKWKPLITSYENNQLLIVLESEKPTDLGYESEMPRIALALNRYRQQSNASLPRVVVSGGCGAGDVGVQIVLRPPNGRVFFIPRFAYLLCGKQGLNPDDTIQCDRWREAVGGSLSYVAGDYIYLARWSDGTVRKGPLGFNNIGQDGATIVINKDAATPTIQESR